MYALKNNAAMKKEFTFILMVYNINDLNSLQDLEQLRATEVLAQLSGIDTAGFNLVTIENLPRFNDSHTGTFNNTEVFDITGPGGGSEIVRKRLFNMGKTNIGDTDSLAGLMMMIKLIYPAEKYVIFTFDHSNFIGHVLSNVVNKAVFSAESAFAAINIAVKNIKNGLPAMKTISAINTPDETDDAIAAKEKFRKLSKQEQVRFAKDAYDIITVSKSDMLTNGELADALFKAFPLNPPPGEAGRVEAVFFNTCYTGCVDNLYLYAKAVNYLVLSEGEVHYNSINIKKVIEYFRESKGNTAAAVTRCVTNFSKDFIAMNTDDEALANLKGTILSAVNLSNNFQEKFRSYFNPLLRSLMSEMDTVYKVISDADGQALWLDCFYIHQGKLPEDLGKDPSETYTRCYDLFSFLDTLTNEPRLKRFHELHDNIDLLRSFLNNIQLKVFPGENVDPQYRGLSIFLPVNATVLGNKKKAQVAFNYSPFSDFQNEFARHTLWPEFLQLLNKFKQAELDKLPFYGRTSTRRLSSSPSA